MLQGSPGSPRFGWHVDRDRLLAEAHARPSTPLEAPIVAIRLANVSGQEAAETDRSHMATLCDLFGECAPDRRARWWALDGPGWSMRWERHTEFSSWTLFCPPPSAADPRGALERLPADWLAAFPADVIVATMLELRRDDTGNLTPPMASDGVQIGAQVLEGAARVFTDFRADDSGMTRFRLLLQSRDAALAGRLALMLLEIETYRMMALLAFPLAGEAAVQLRAI